MAESHHPSSISQSWRHLLRRGMASLQRGNTAAALVAFEQALSLSSDEPEVLLAVGRERMRAGQFARAEAPLQQVWRQQPSTAGAAALARLLGLHLDRRKEAFQLLHQALAMDPNALDLHVIRGELLLEDEAILEARAAFGCALEKDRACEAARVGLARTFNAEGIALGEAGQAERAVFALKRATDLDPAWSGPYVNLGVIFGRLGRLDRAVVAYLDALERDPANPVASFNLGTTYHELGHHSLAVEAFEELLSRQPDYPHLRISLANVLGDMQEFDKAIALLLEELEIDEISVQAWSSLGLAYACSGNLKRGEECLRRAVTIDPGHFNAYHNLAVLYATQGRPEQAEMVLRQAFDIDARRAAELLSTEPSLALFKDVARRWGEFPHSPP